MSEQDRVDTPEHDDEVEAHKTYTSMTQEPDSSESDDVEAHKTYTSMTQEADSSDDDDDFEAHKAYNA
jgi:hypothetical protein